MGFITLTHYLAPVDGEPVITPITSLLSLPTVQAGAEVAFTKYF